MEGQVGIWGDSDKEFSIYVMKEDFLSPAGDRLPHFL